MLPVKAAFRFVVGNTYNAGIIRRWYRYLVY